MVENAARSAERAHERNDRNSERLAALETRETLCHEQVLEPLRLAVEKLNGSIDAMRDAVRDPQSGLVALTAKVKGLADTNVEVVVQLSADRDARLKREAVDDDRQNRSRRMKWIVLVGATALSAVVAVIHYWVH